MNDDVLAYLRCPLCDAPLTGATALRCARGHTFDVARHGYVNLAAGRSPHAGDTAEMVAARAAFLAAGHYDFVAAALSDAARQRHPGAGLVLDAGTGTGHYLGAVLDALPHATGLGLDVSKPALRRAARAHPRAGAALTDLWRPLPVADGAAGLLLNVFAPRNPAEFRRVLRRDGALLVVTPAADHLSELVTQLGLLRVDPDKSERVTTGLQDAFTAADRQTHRRTLRLTHAHVGTLVAMGPSAWHLEPHRLAAAVAGLPEPVPVTAAIELTVHLPR